MTNKNKPEVETATPELAAADTFRILVLDKHEHVEQLKAACKNAGHSVVPAYSVDQATEFLAGPHHADVIICAAYLEDQNIFEFLKRLRAKPEHNSSMFMILSLAPGPYGVQLNASVKIAGHHLGSDAFVSMPVFDPVQLIAAIKTLLPVVPWLERTRQEDQVKKDALEELEKIRHELSRKIEQAEKLASLEATDLELVSSKAALKKIEEIFDSTI